MINDFEQYMENEGKSKNTILSYRRHIEQYIEWFSDTYGSVLNKLFRENVLEYKSYLKNIKKDNAKTVNAKLSALLKFNEYLISKGIQNDTVISKKDNIKIQTQYASPATVTKLDVENFRQKVLENEGLRNYAIVTLLAYTGVRISEALSIKMNDFSLESSELIIRDGKGEKQRLICFNDKVTDAIRGWIKERTDKGINDEYLFVSQKGNRLNRTVINRMFQKHSEIITPHTLRHFFCSYALENGFAIHEVANIAGHSNIHTTLLYTNPSKQKMKEKMNML